MLTEFDQVFELFEKEVYSRLHERHFDAGKELHNFKIQIQAQSLSGDIGYCAMILRDFHLAAIQETSDRLDKQILSDNKSPQTIPLVNEKFVTSFKSFMFFIRAYYDVIYNIGIASLEHTERRWLKESLFTAIDEQQKSATPNKVLEALSVKIPDFMNWFLKMRELRNAIKYGIGVGHETGKNFITGEVKVSFQIKPLKNENPIILNLSNVADILRMTTKVTGVILDIKTNKTGIDNTNSN